MLILLMKKQNKKSKTVLVKYADSAYTRTQPENFFKVKDIDHKLFGFFAVG